MPTERGKKWKIKTKPEILAPKLEATHGLSAEEISRAYASIDEAYERAKKVLDQAGIMATHRAIYRAYMEELWKLSSKFSGNVLRIQADCVALKYVAYDTETEILKKIGKLFGLDVLETVVVTRITYGLDADRPIDPDVGEVYYATDVQTIYICRDAGGWVAIPKEQGLLCLLDPHS